MSHSKRNTSRPVFTAHERALAKSAWSASSARLSRDSFLPFGSCSLCLATATDPVACGAQGHIFCRECALADILAQKQEIRRRERAREVEEREERERVAKMDEEARERAVREFELLQAGFDVGGGKKGTVAVDEKLEKEEAGGKKRALEGGGAVEKKRKFVMDEEEVARAAEQDRLKQRKAMEDEKNAKAVLPSFWVPSVTPISNSKDKLHEVKKKAKTSPICPASQEHNQHAYALHNLVSIHFTEDGASSQQDGKPKTRICPSCKKGLTNSSKAMLAKPCGHVLCKPCATQFMKPAGAIDSHADPDEADTVRCFVCDEDVTERPVVKKGGDKKEKDKIRPGLVELKSDGTGFSAGGVNEVKRTGTAFQC